MQARTFRFDPPFRPEQLDVFLSDFFGDAQVQAAMPVSTGPGSWGPLGPVKPAAVRHSPLRSTVLRLDFFDRLNEAEVVRNGAITKCARPLNLLPPHRACSTCVSTAHQVPRHAVRRDSHLGYAAKATARRGV
jgi:hypothetical protein